MEESTDGDNTQQETSQHTKWTEQNGCLKDTSRYITHNN